MEWLGKGCGMRVFGLGVRLQVRVSACIRKLYVCESGVSACRECKIKFV